MGSELRLAIRRLAKEPALAIAAVVTLALGIGACTAMFSIVEAVLLKSMDIARPQRLVVMWPQFGDTAGEFSYNAAVRDIRARCAQRLGELAGSRRRSAAQRPPHAGYSVRCVGHVLRCAWGAAAARTDLPFR